MWWVVSDVVDIRNTIIISFYTLTQHFWWNPTQSCWAFFYICGLLCNTRDWVMREDKDMVQLKTPILYILYIRPYQYIIQIPMYVMSLPLWCYTVQPISLSQKQCYIMTCCNISDNVLLIPNNMTTALDVSHGIHPPLVINHLPDYPW